MTGLEVLRALRASEQSARSEIGYVGVIAMIDADVALGRLVLAWPMVDLPDKAFLDVEIPSKMAARYRLRWLFGLIDPDPTEQWLVQAGLVDAPHVRRAVDMALDNKICLPDGTLSAAADTWVKRAARRVVAPRSGGERAGG